MAKSQSSSKASTLAAKVWSGAKKPTLSDAKTLAERGWGLFLLDGGNVLI